MKQKEQRWNKDGRGMNNKSDAREIAVKKRQDESGGTSTYSYTEEKE
jgi:hypothetical protein